MHTGRLAVIVLTVWLSSISTAQDAKPRVAFGGIFTSGSPESFPMYSRTQQQTGTVIFDQLQVLNAKGELSFELLLETDAETMKWDIGNAFSLGVLVTRDDIETEEFDAHSESDAKIYKTVVNVGLVVFIYQTVEGIDKRNIIYTAPMVGYSTLKTAEAPPDDARLNSLFVQSVEKLFAEHLAARLRAFSLKNLRGAVNRNRRGTITIDIGRKLGLEDGQTVSFMDGDSVVGRGVARDVQEGSATIEVTTEGYAPDKKTEVMCRNLRGFSDETFQVVSFKNSSKLADELFADSDIGGSVAQFVTDFLASVKGKIVLPARSGSWIQGSVEMSSAILVKDGESYAFALPSPKYPLHLELTGLSRKLVKESSVNEVYGYKAWLQCSSPRVEYSYEADHAVTKSKVKGLHEFDDTDVFFNLLYDLSRKLAEECEL